MSAQQHIGSFRFRSSLPGSQALEWRPFRHKSHPFQLRAESRHATPCLKWQPVREKSAAAFAALLLELERTSSGASRWRYHQIGSGAYGLELHTLPALLSRSPNRWLHHRRALQIPPKTVGPPSSATSPRTTKNGMLESIFTRRR